MGDSARIDCRSEFYLAGCLVTASWEQESTAALCLTGLRVNRSITKTYFGGTLRLVLPLARLGDEYEPTCVVDFQGYN